MKDPVRMIDAGDDATAFERDLLRAGRGAKLSSEDRARIWTGLTAQLVLPVSPPSPGVGSTSAHVGTAVAPAAATASLIKGAVVAIVLAGAAAAGYRATRPVAPVAAAPAGTIAPASSNESVGVAAPVIDPQRAPGRAIDEATHEEIHEEIHEATHQAKREATPHRPPASRLAAEGQLVLEARGELRAGRAAAALARLEAARAEFADGALVQEREALTIEALQRTGRGDEARRRAEVFVRAYPSSPHAARVKQLAAP